jgi:hypothetical protein
MKAKSRIRKAYDDFTNAIVTSNLGDLRQFSKFLKTIEKGDSGPGGELAREVRLHVDAHIEEWFPSASMYKES